MTIDRRSLLGGGAAGIAIAAVGIRTSLAALPETHVRALLGTNEAVAEWLLDLRVGFDQEGVTDAMASMLVRMNALMIHWRPDLLPVVDRFVFSDQADDPEASNRIISTNTYEMGLSLSLSLGTEKTEFDPNSSVAQQMVEIAAHQATLELQAMREKHASNGMRMLPCVPIRQMGIRLDPQTFQPVQGFSTLFGLVKAV